MGVCSSSLTGRVDIHGRPERASCNAFVGEGDRSKFAFLHQTTSHGEISLAGNFGHSHSALDANRRPTRPFAAYCCGARPALQNSCAENLRLILFRILAGR